VKPCLHETIVDGCKTCLRYQNDAQARARWDAPTVRTVPARPSARTLPCIKLGDRIGSELCKPCSGKVQLFTHACRKFGTCVLGRSRGTFQGCEDCDQYQADTNHLVAPCGRPGGQARPWGSTPQPSWTWPATVAIPHLETLDLLDLAVKLWRKQTIRPYLVIVDTGSCARTLDELERYRDTDCEIHHLRRNSYYHTSAPVTHALDLATSLCDTNYLVHTHTDTFPKRRDTLEHFLALCSAERPVVGLRCSPRGGTDWRDCLSHVLLVLHRATIQRAGVHWSMSLAYDLTSKWGQDLVGWPDTATAFGLMLRERGIKPYFYGDEQNWTPYVCEWFDHVCGLPGLRVHGGGMTDTCNNYARPLIQSAIQRVLKWENEMK